MTEYERGAAAMREACVLRAKTCGDGREAMFSPYEDGYRFARTDIAEALAALPLPTDPTNSEGKDSKNPTESVGDASCQTQGFASTVDQLDTVLGRREPISSGLSVALADSAVYFTAPLAADAGKPVAHVAAITRECMDDLGVTPRRIDVAANGEGAEAIESYQARADKWLIACFGLEIARDKIERNHRFIEEALELVQACGCTQSEAHQIVDYVFGRPVGEIGQEVGGVMNTLAALCLAHGFDMDAEADREIARCWTKLEKIRAKQAAKPKHSPLPAHVTPDHRDAEIATLRAKSDEWELGYYALVEDISSASCEWFGEALPATPRERVAELVEAAVSGARAATNLGDAKQEIAMLRAALKEKEEFLRKAVERIDGSYR